MKGQESVSWFEFQFGGKNNFHVDLVILNLTTRELLVAEAKRYNNPAVKIKEVKEDIQRIHNLVCELKTENANGIVRIDMDKIKRCYGIVLADVWTETSQKMKILQGYSVGCENPKSENSFINKYMPNLELGRIWYDVRNMPDIKDVERYNLLSFVYEIGL